MKTITILPLVFFLLQLVSADDVYYCNATVSCPEEYPCCGAAIGECGTGSYCLQCDPRYSYNISACMPAPICRDSLTTFSVDVMGDYDNFLGNASTADWLYTGYLMDYDDGMILAMPNQTSGTVMYSSRYMWYGKVTAKFKSSRGQGVVSAFILYSNVQDEIDFEFVGADLYKVQTNFYYEGVLNYTNGKNITMDNSTFDYFHEYSIEWTEDEIIWAVNGVAGRTLQREDTYNETSGQYMFPQTPSKIELSLWPAGDSENAVGTIDWAGGEIDWNAADLKDPGYLYAILESIEIECYDPPSGTEITGDNAYVYNSSTDFSQDSVMITDDRTYLGSTEATGWDPSLGEEDEEDDEEDSSSSTDLVTSEHVTTVVSTNSNGKATTAVSTKTLTSTSVTVTGFLQDSKESTTTSTGAGATMSPNTFILSVISLISYLFL